eukprot:7503019-Pyramimonas_sp.AAC.1
MGSATNCLPLTAFDVDLNVCNWLNTVADCPQVAAPLRTSDGESRRRTSDGEPRHRTSGSGPRAGNPGSPSDTDLARPSG